MAPTPLQSSAAQKLAKAERALREGAALIRAAEADLAAQCERSDSAYASSIHSTDLRIVRNGREQVERVASVVGNMAVGLGGHARA